MTFFLSDAETCRNQVSPSKVWSYAQHNSHTPTQGPKVVSLLSLSSDPFLWQMLLLFQGSQDGYHGKNTPLPGSRVQGPLCNSDISPTCSYHTPQRRSCRTLLHWLRWWRMSPAEAHHLAGKTDLQCRLGGPHSATALSGCSWGPTPTRKEKQLFQHQTDPHPIEIELQDFSAADYQVLQLKNEVWYRLVKKFWRQYNAEILLPASESPSILL